MDARLQAFIRGPLERALRFSTKEPGIIIASAVAMITLSGALIPAGLIRVQFFPAVEGDNVVADLEMPEGTTVERTRQVTERQAPSAAPPAGRRDPTSRRDATRPNPVYRGTECNLLYI